MEEENKKLTKEEKKALKEEKKKKRKQEGKGLWKEFKAFISRGNVLDMAVGVIMGSAFGTIVTAFTNILLSICTWGVPGGLKGLITVLPAANSAQAGISGIGQSFQASNIVESTIAYAASQGVTITAADDTFIQWQNALLTKYTLHGTTYTYNMSSVIDWGTFINAVISFLIIALTLFVIIKVYKYSKKKREEYKEKLQEEYYKKHPEERPIVAAPEAPKPTELDLLTSINEQLIELNKTKK